MSNHHTILDLKKCYTLFVLSNYKSRPQEEVGKVTWWTSSSFWVVLLSLPPFCVVLLSPSSGWRCCPPSPCLGSASWCAPFCGGAAFFLLLEVVLLSPSPFVEPPFCFVFVSVIIIMIIMTPTTGKEEETSNTTEKEGGSTIQEGESSIAQWRRE